MTSRAVVLLVCDRCGTSNAEDEVETHQIAGLEGEACKRCWKDIYTESLEAWLDATRTLVEREPAKRRYQRRQSLSSVELANQVNGQDVTQWPDTPWRFTSHALLRMGERHIMMEDLLPILKSPAATRPGDKQDGIEVWWTGDVKVVVNPEQRAVLTVAHMETTDA